MMLLQLGSGQTPPPGDRNCRHETPKSSTWKGRLPAPCGGEASVGSHAAILRSRPLRTSGGSGRRRGCDAAAPLAWVTRGTRTTNSWEKLTSPAQMPHSHLLSAKTGGSVSPARSRASLPQPQAGWTLQAPELCPFSGGTDKARAEQQVKGGTLRPPASRVRGGGGSRERQKKWPSSVEPAIARRFHKNAH